MPHTAEIHPLLQGLNKSDYNVESLDDEIRVDSLCVDLLRHLYQELVQKKGVQPEQAGERCHGADYFLREFVIPERHKNLFEVEAIDLRQFAGHWYIIRTPEPNLTELGKILAGTAELYNYLASQKMVSQETTDAITTQSEALDYFQKRIDAFWAIEGEGYDTWRDACPL